MGFEAYLLDEVRERSVETVGHVCDRIRAGGLKLENGGAFEEVSEKEDEGLGF